MNEKATGIAEMRVGKGCGCQAGIVIEGVRLAFKKVDTHKGLKGGGCT